MAPRWAIDSGTLGQRRARASRRTRPTMLTTTAFVRRPRLVHVARLAVALLAVARLCAASLTAQAEGTQKLTFAQVLGEGPTVDFRGSPPSVRWAPDGVHLQLSGTAWRHPATGAEIAPPKVDPKPDPRAEHQAALVAAGLAEDAARRLVARRQPAGDGAFLVQQDDALWFWREGGKARQVSKGGARRILQASPTGRHLSFVRDENLIVVDTDSGAEWAVSTDGSDDLLYGVLDWVYQEEVYGRGDFQGHWWSPKGDAVAFLRIDESPVKTFMVIDHIVRGKTLDEERHVRQLPMKYPKAGDENPWVTLGLARPGSREIRWVDLAAFPKDLLIVHVGFDPSGTKLVFQVQDRIQTWLELCYADLGTGKVTSILREESKTGWVNRLEQPRWLADGSFLWMSERTGRQQLYHYEADGRLRRALTEAPLVVANLERVDEKQGLFWVTGHDGRAVDSHLFRGRLDGAAKVQRLTQGDGTHTASLNSDGSFFLDSLTSLRIPMELRLCSGEGKVVEVLGAAKPKDLEAWGHAAPEAFTVTCRDGFELDATLLKARDIDLARAHPIWVETYSGPDAPTVRNVWATNTWLQFLAQQGYLVLQVNVRSASRKGQWATEKCYKQLAVQELLDLEDAIAQVGKNAWADTTRVGITGWSYGGTMTAFALTRSKAFKLGIAGAGVYDWRLYDTIYTERYMDTPQRNAAGYAKTSVIEGAKDLHGHLLLLHGTMDDNVHLQNCMQFAYALQKAGKQFDLMVYPAAMHGVTDPQQSRHMRTLVWNTIQKHLGGAAN